MSEKFINEYNFNSVDNSLQSIAICINEAKSYELSAEQTLQILKDKNLVDKRFTLKQVFDSRLQNPRHINENKYSASIDALLEGVSIDEAFSISSLVGNIKTFFKSKDNILLNKIRFWLNKRLEYPFCDNVSEEFTSILNYFKEPFWQVGINDSDISKLYLTINSPEDQIITVYNSTDDTYELYCKDKNGDNIFQKRVLYLPNQVNGTINVWHNELVHRLQIA